MGRKSRDKGARIEREIVALHRDMGIEAERVPRSGAAGGSFSGDMLIASSLRAEVKARANGEAFATIERWLGDNDMLFLHRDRAEPLVVMPWGFYKRLMMVFLRDYGLRPTT